MFEFFAQHPSLLIPCVVIFSLTAITLVAILTSQWRAVRQSEQEVALKQDLLNRGMGVDDIERVLRASAVNPPAEPEKPDPISDNEYYLVEKLVDEEKSAEEIERIIRALKGSEPASREYRVTTSA
jgi:hypothetical protein